METMKEELEFMTESVKEDEKDRGRESEEMTETEKKQKDVIIRDGKNCYLRVLLEDGTEPGYEIKMINRTQPGHFLRISLMEQYHRLYLDYNITGLVPVSEVEKNDLLTYLYAIISSLSRLGEECAEYLIPAEKVDLSPEHIFLRMETGQIYYVFSPEKQETQQESLQLLLEHFMKNANLVHEEDVLNVYGMYQKTLEKNVTFQGLYDYLKEARRNPEDGAFAYGVASKETERQKTDDRSPENALYGSLGIDVEDETPFDAWAQKQEKTTKVPWDGTEDFGSDENREASWYAQSDEPKPQSEASGKTGVFSKLKKFFTGKPFEIGLGVVVFAVSAWLLLS